MTKTNLNKPKHNLSSFYFSFYNKFKQFLKLPTERQPLQNKYKIFSFLRIGDYFNFY